MPYNQFFDLGQSFSISPIFMNRGFFSGIKIQDLTPKPCMQISRPRIFPNRVGDYRVSVKEKA